MNMHIEIGNSERIQLLKLVNAEVRKATNKPFAGRQKLETLYGLQSKLALQTTGRS